MAKSKKKKKEKEDDKVELIIVAREEWGARHLTREVSSLKLPVTYVRFSYTNTKEENCAIYDSCCSELRRYQETFQERGLPDIPFNFLIGQDGRVYEGRGWYLDVERHECYKKFKRKCIDVTYIGEFSRCLPPEHMTDVAAELVSYGIRLKMISEMPRIESLNDYRDYLYAEDQEI